MPKTMQDKPDEPEGELVVRPHNRTLTEGQMTIVKLYENPDPNERGKARPRFGLRNASGMIPIGPLKRNGDVYVKELKAAHFTRDNLAIMANYRDDARSLVDFAMDGGHLPSPKLLIDIKSGNLSRFDAEVLQKLRRNWMEVGIEGSFCYFHAVPIHQIVIDPRTADAKLVCDKIQPQVLVPVTAEAAISKWGIKDDDFLKELAICAFWIVSHNLVGTKQAWTEKKANELVRGWRAYLDKTQLWPFFQEYVKRKVAELESGR